MIVVFIQATQLLRLPGMEQLSVHVAISIAVMNSAGKLLMESLQRPHDGLSNSPAHPLLHNIPSFFIRK
jgi:hypothetical protein